jgi:ribosomal protein S18 acetylase RimI-like enzyme
MEILKVENDSQIKLTAELAGEIWRQHFCGIISDLQIEYMLDKFQSYEAINRQIASENYNYFLIKDDNGVFQGYFAVAPRKDTLFLSKIYIRKESRGKGFAGKSVEFMKSFAEKSGISNITLTVNRNNSDTINIYKKMDFKITGEADTDIGNGFFMNDYIMKLEVKA